MSTPTSLDTVVATPRLLSGHNFREVAPEALSPLSWSIIGAGMETGFRHIAARLHHTVPWGPPAYVAYVAFRPFHVMSSIQQLWALLPGVRPSDLWEFLLGGEPPSDSSRSATRRRSAVTRLPRAAWLAHSNDEQLGRVTAAVSGAERAVLACYDCPTTAVAGDAWARSVEVGRMAWALHIRTTAVAAAVASWYRQALAHEHGVADGTELLLAHARRSSDGWGRGYDGGLVPDPDGRSVSYEVADLSPAFARWSHRPLGSTGQLGLGPRGNQFAPSPAADQLVRSRLSPLSHRAGRILERMLGEREQSKSLGLRALHCVRCLLDQTFDDCEPDQTAMLGAHELTRLSRSDQQRLVKERRAELDAVADEEVPVDCRQIGATLTPVARSSKRFADAEAIGVPLAPGWASGRLVERSGGPHAVLCGETVDASFVVATRPAAVVTRYGSLLSHLAIVCRELGIPLVAGLQIEPTARYGTVEVDGWSGTVTPSRGPDR
jgi:phosphohistidine swiveling domain-containing protein